MIDAIKHRLVEFLRRKDVSLALIFDRGGRILWHAGRTVEGSDVRCAGGFPRSVIQKVLETGEGLEAETVVEAGDLSRSAKSLFIRSLWVRPLGAGVFLYVDSGSRDSFDATDRQVFDTLGGLLAEALTDASQRRAGSGGLSGASEQMAAARDLAARYAVEEDPVLIVGETGVGKNRVAELIHGISGRRGAFVVAHVPSIPEDLVERELFGHRRGAFTGADSDRPGLFDEARDGTLLLDEIAEVPVPIQAKLLRVVESLRFRPVGATKESEARVRLLAATNRDLAAEVRGRRFRDDLYFRLGVLQLRLPPLRERPADLRALVEENARLLRGKRLDDDALTVLCRHTWPGNVRELLHVLTRVGIEIDAHTVGAEIARFVRPNTADADDPLDLVRQQMAAGAGFWEAAWPAFLDRELNREQLTSLLREGFAACAGSLKRLAAELRIGEQDYPRFVATLHKYDIHPRRRDA